MIQGLYRATLFALYQTVVFVGILAMPVALLARRAGVTVPLGRVVETVGEAYEAAEGNRDTMG
jgi:hypothetical protein